MKLVRFLPEWLDELLKALVFAHLSEWMVGSADPRKRELVELRADLQRKINFLQIRVDTGAELERAALRKERDTLTVRIQVFGF